MEQDNGASASGPGSSSLRSPETGTGSAHAGDDPSRGWIGWDGGECPVDPEALVDVKWNNGAVSRASRAGLYATGGAVGDADLWKSRGRGGHIIAYRLAPETPIEVEPELAYAVEELRGCLIRRASPTCEVRKEFLRAVLDSLDDYRAEIAALGHDLERSMSRENQMLNDARRRDSAGLQGIAQTEPSS